MADLSRYVFGRQTAIRLFTDTGAPADDFSSLPLINDTNWATLTTAGWSYYQVGATTPATIISDGTAPQSPPSVLAVDMTGSDFGTASIHDTQLNVSTPRELAVTFWMKVSANWETSGIDNGGGRLAVLFPNAGGGAAIYLSCGVPGCPDAPNDATMRIAATLWDSPGSFRLPNVGSTSILRNTWHRITLYYKFETAQESSADGIFRAWVDGVLNTELLTLTYPLAMGTYFSTWAFSWSKYVATGQTMYVDHTTIRGQ